MKTIHYKTNLKCSGCVAKVTPFLNEISGEGNWSVDLHQPIKYVLVNADISFEKIKQAFDKAGFKVEE
ncbi:MAG: heavy-metal-associated domain-containing protein [Cyclobacteriaceae bacterium]|jgi:copper chaperone|nr:heavy-metal-associated domain-containing protein [Flammeovirgaceae bacterium]MCZ8022215.1 heavy-metal-associated domain-containing protein [Cytophagales bacterium]MCZ8329275.1 heavy-metal-associated domain-containing protein [Cyclobacteriaceae bacterium]